MTRQTPANEDKLEPVLAQHFERDLATSAKTEETAASRVLAALARPLPPQKRPWRLWPTELLDWNFAPAWPRVAALAGCAALGFAFGAIGPISHNQASAIVVAQNANSGFVSVLSAPEPLSGGLP